MKQSIEVITPSMAAQMLSANPINRKKRQGWINDLSDLILRGEWKCTHQGIAISKSGYLLDGQHRLEAIVKSGASVPMSVSRELDDDSFSVIDRGITRTMADCTRIPKMTVEVINFLHNMSCGRASKPTAQQVFGIYKKVGAVADELHLYAPTRTKTFASVGVRSAIVILTIEGQTKCFEYYRKLTLSEFDELPQIINVFVKKAVSGTITSDKSNGGAAQVEIFCKALFAFSHLNAHKTKFPHLDADFMKAKREFVSSFLLRIDL